MNKKILIFAPHEDDEVLQTAGIIRQAVTQGGTVYVCLVTNGEYEDERLAAVRIGESTEVLGMLGVPPEQIIKFGFADTGMPYEQSFLMQLLRDESGRVLPSRFGRTESWVPEGFSDYRMIRDGTHSPYTREGVLRDFTDLIAELRPDEIYTTAPGDYHGDHAACPAFVELAVERVRQDDSAYLPRRYHCMIHTADEAAWPLRTEGAFTKPPDCDALGLDWEARQTRPLPEGFTAADKRALIERYASQDPSAYGDYLLAFAKTDEIVFPVS